MDVTAEIGRNPVSKEARDSAWVRTMSRLTRDGTAEPVSRDQILRRERGQGEFHFPCAADHEQDWQPPRLIHTYILRQPVASVAQK